MLLAGATAVSVPGCLTRSVGGNTFSFILLGDLHFDRLAHHDLDWLRKEKPDDLRQVQDYSRLTAEILPKLFATVREVVAGSNRSPGKRAAFVVQAGDFVEGLCGSEERARRQNAEAIEFVRQARLGVPFLFTKGNHDVTGPGAAEAFKTVFHPFLSEQRAGFSGGGPLTSARYAIEHRGAQFCFFDAYDKESLGWLETALARRTARHCFVVLHPPVVPYGARSTWHLFSGERDTAQRERLLELLGQHNAFVLSGHIHKYSVLVRATPRGGRFLQLAASSVISSPEVAPKNLLTGIARYNADQVSVEPAFSPATEKQRRAVYETEAPFVRQFEYADLPGYAVVDVNGPSVTAQVYAGVGQNLWRTLELNRLLEETARRELPSATGSATPLSL